MKRSLALIVTLASGIALSAAAQTSPAPAATAAPAGPAKIALIAFRPVVGSTNEFQRNLGDLEKKFQPREAQAKALADEIESLTKQLQTQGSMLSESESASRLKAIEAKKTQYQRTGEDLKKDEEQEAEEAFEAVANKVGAVMVAYAQQQGYTMILDTSLQQSQVLWADGSADISKAVLEAYNVKSGVPAPPAQPAAAAPKPAAPAPKPAGTAPATH
jgi:outer membrane protein